MEKTISHRETPIIGPVTNISNRDLSSEWAAEIKKQLLAAEEAESGLSYVSECGTELARKLLGSYYTPVDVARFFWQEFFKLKEIKSPSEAAWFIDTHRFVEPAVGAGALFFALIEKLALMGVPPKLLATIDIEFIDINGTALDFVRDRIAALEIAWGVKFEKTRYLHQDFRDVHFKRSAKPRVFFGNPPFVTNARETSRWKNLFADFLETALNVAGPEGAVHFIVPLSIAFSRDYRNLRKFLRERKNKIQLSNFDNIPDTLFKAGKPLHCNTNKANSQRCTIISVVPSEELNVSSTPLLRWPKAERPRVLGTSPRYLDISNYTFDDQFPRPCNERIIHYLDQCRGAPCFWSLVNSDGNHSLFVAGVARNYIGIRAEEGNGIHDIRFDEKDEMLKALAIISSDLFFDYWLTIGDGFHLTKSNIMNFPLHPALQKTLSARLPEIRKTWRARRTYLKAKLNSGRETRSFDFSSAFRSLYLSRVS